MLIKKNFFINNYFRNIKRAKDDMSLVIKKDRTPFDDMLDYVSSLDLSCDDIDGNFSVLQGENNEKVQTINWFIPNAEHILYGGVYTILRFANYFQEKGVKNRLVFYSGIENNENLRLKIVNEFKSLGGAEYIFFNGNMCDLPECDVTISTFWSSCYISAKFNKTKKKFYFIQDYEPLFYAAGTVNSVLAEATYRFGFRGIVNTPGLCDFVVKQHNMKCLSFLPRVDKSIYSITEKEIEDKFEKDVVNIVFYGRPNKNRNAFEIGLMSLLKIKQKYQDNVAIFSVGDDWDEKEYGVEGKIRNLGRLKTLKEVADIYKKSDIGLTMMFTKHPSYQPFELMACGCAVVANYNDANKWFLKDGENCIISEPMPSCIAEKISMLIENKKLRMNIVQNGLKEIGSHHWNDECEKIFSYIND